ncbi:MAG: hypothetical protein ACI9BD_000106 [Candidatus Marinamargulisbacteria bacterium]|jgi:hypothetical protein
MRNEVVENFKDKAHEHEIANANVNARKILVNLTKKYGISLEALMKEIKG